MVKQRKSLLRVRLPADDLDSSSSSSSSSSAASNINVGGGTRQARSASLSSTGLPQSTPPTSLPEDSISDVASDKHAVLAHMNPNAAQEEADQVAAHRASRRKSGPATYNLAALSGVKRVTSVEALKAKEARSLSGDTLVTAAPASSADTPRQKLLTGAVEALDMDWDMDAVPTKQPATSTSPLKPKRRNSTHLQKISYTMDRAKEGVKKVLGKRSRDAIESTKEAGRRSSRRISTLSSSLPNDTNADDQDSIQRPSKVARLTSSLNMPTITSALHLSISKPRERPFKKWEKQGLYVGQSQNHTGPDGNASKKRSNNKSRPSSLASSIPAKTEVLPLPMFDYLDRDRSFKLPFDIFAPQWRERGEEKPKDWGKINKNRFVGDAKDGWKTEKLARSACQCKVNNTGCGDNCWNQSMGVECDDNNCDVGPDCGNRDFAELSARMERANTKERKSFYYLYNAGVEVIKTSDRGFGVRSCRTFRPNEIITEYTGEIITQREAQRRVREEYTGKSDYYQMEFDQGMILDATKGSIARFVNHSCNPNCVMVKRTVSGRPRMALFAGEEGIMTGEELTYDYNFDPYSLKNVQKCLCGAYNCRGVLGPKPADLKKPSSKKEKDDMASDLKRVASSASNKRGVSEAKFDDEATAIIPELIKKRKVPKMTKGWVYVDEEMEQKRKEEEALDRELVRLQREGVINEKIVEKLNDSRPRYPGRGSMKKAIDKAKSKFSAPSTVSAAAAAATTTTISSSSGSKSRRAKPTNNDNGARDDVVETKSMLSRMSSTLKRKPSTSASSSLAVTVSEKRKSAISVKTTASAPAAGGSLKQSTLNFAKRNAAADASLLANADPSGGGGDDVAVSAARPSSSASMSKLKGITKSLGGAMARSVSSKRNGTVRLVSGDEEGDGEE